MSIGNCLTHTLAKGRYEKSDPAFIGSLIAAGFVKSGDFILDLGCGNAWFTSLFEKEGVMSVGIDLDEAALRSSEFESPKPTLIIGDATKLPFKTEIFDEIFIAGFSLFSVDDLSDTYDFGRYVASFLKPKGKIIFYWSTNLDGGYYGNRSCKNHTLEEVTNYFEGIEMKIELVAFFPRFFAPFLLRTFTFFDIVHRLTSLFSKTTGIRGRLLCVAVKGDA